MTITAHPLDLWLEGKDLKPYQFAEKHKIGLRTIYAQLNGEVENPSLDIMEKIEKGTQKAVTIQMQVEWFRSLKKENRK